METYFADLSGDQEVPALTSFTSGKFHIQFSKDYSEAEFTLRVDDGNLLFMAHLHCALAGANGPVVVWLAGLYPISGGGWNVDGKWIGNTILNSSNIVNPSCGTDLAGLAAAMRAGRVYVNVHSRANPSGEVRGQIVP